MRPILPPPPRPLLPLVLRPGPAGTVTDQVISNRTVGRETGRGAERDGEEEGEVVIEVVVVVISQEERKREKEYREKYKLTVECRYEL